MIKRSKAVSVLSLVLAIALITAAFACSRSKDANTDTNDAISSELGANETSQDKNKISPYDDKKSSVQAEPSNEGKQNSSDNTQSSSDNKKPLYGITSEEESKISPEMTANELKLYEEFVKNHDTSILTGVNPVTIYKMFFKALTSDNLEAQYALYAKGGDAPAPAAYNEFAAKLKEDENYNNDLKNMLNSFNKNFKTLEVKYYDKTRATMEVNDENDWEMSFGLYKASDGVWKVLWYPVTT